METLIRKSKKRPEKADMAHSDKIKLNDLIKRKAKQPSLNLEKGLLLLAVLAATALGYNMWKKFANKPVNWWLLLSFITIPVVSVTSIALSMKAASHERLIALAVIGAIFGNLFPKFISVFLVCSGMVLFALSTRPAHSIQHKRGNFRGQTLTVIAAVATSLSLLVENFFIWVVSATYVPSHKGSPQPLQDNGRLLLNFLTEGVMNLKRRDVVEIRGLMNVQWALVAAAFMAFVVAELQLLKKRTLLGLGLRALATFATVRMIRTISFLLTVLPSQNPRCYTQHFPMPPEDWISWFMVGMLPQTHGGCNDLIISGHACVTSSLACLATSAANNKCFTIALWSLLIIDFCIEVYEGFHYSVDMWMGGLITFLLWKSFAPLEDEIVSDNREYLSLSSVTKEEFVLFLIPAFMAYVVIVVLPEEICNYFALGYIFFSAVYIFRKGFSHFIQHVLLCLLFLALAIYL
jgi:PAP2 superfamily C-terminal